MNQLICSVAVIISSLALGQVERITLPTNLPVPNDEQTNVQIPISDGSTLESTLNPYLQNHLTRYIYNHGNPIAAVVVVDVKTGAILAMAQGRSPKEWNSTSHSALYSRFPAASLFKTVVASAVFELTGIQPTEKVGLNGGCGSVRPSGVWLEDKVSGSRRKLSLRRAFGQSCNGYFAKLAINEIGLNALKNFAARYSWNKMIGSDFKVDPSPMDAPSGQRASVHSVGRFAAGFGYVGMSAVHSAWMNLAIANNGVKKDLHLFKRSLKVNQGDPNTLVLSAKALKDQQLISVDTALKIRSIMDATVRGGTASFAFRRGKHRRLRNFVGGKTGTLTGHAPKGVTTWFTGMMPLDEPQVVVAAVVVLDKLWHIKGPNLAAEAFWAYKNMIKKKEEKLKMKPLVKKI